MKATTVFAVAAALLVACASAKFTKGSLDTKSEDHYISKFTMSSSKGDQSKDGVTVKYWPEDFGPRTYWAVFVDNKWDSIYHSKKNCSEKVAGADWTSVFKQPIQPGGSVTISQQFTDRMRPHIWFLTILNCENNGEAQHLDVSYEATWRNIDGSQVGYDEIGMKALYACYFVFFFIMMVVHGFGDVFLWLRNSFHHIVRMLLACLVMMMFANMFDMIHWAKYEGDGVGCDGCLTFAGILDNASYIVFTLLLTMIASGWAITNQTLTRKWWILGLFVADSISFLALFIINSSGNGDEKAANINTSYVRATSYGGAGIFFFVVYLISWLCTLGYFGFATWTSYRDESQYDKRLFYMIFGGCYAVWFILVPVVSLLALAVDAWLRQRIVSAFHETVTFLGMAVLVVLLWPTFVYKYFRIIAPDLLTDNPSGL